MIDKEISEIVENQYQRAISILEENKDKLTELANELLEKEVIFKESLERIFGPRPFETPELVDASSQNASSATSDKTEDTVEDTADAAVKSQASSSDLKGDTSEEE